MQEGDAAEDAREAFRAHNSRNLTVRRRLFADDDDGNENSSETRRGLIDNRKNELYEEIRKIREEVMNFLSLLSAN